MRRNVLSQVERPRDLGRRGVEKCRELRQVHAVFPVVVPQVAAYLARAVSRRPLARRVPRRRVAALPISALQMRRTSPPSLVSVVTMSLSRLQIWTSCNSPGCVVTTATRISSIFDRA